MTRHIQKINRVFRSTTNQQGAGIMKKIASLTIVAIVVAALSSLCMGTAQAANVTWQGGDGAWQTDSNWVTNDDPAQNRVPVAGDVVYVENGGTARITATTGSVPGSGSLSTIYARFNNSKIIQSGGSVIAASAPIGGYLGGGTYELQGGTFTLSGTLDMSAWNQSGQIGNFIQSGGTATVNSVRMNFKGSGAAYIEVTDGSLNVSGDIVMAYGGGSTDTAWLTQSGGTVTIGGQLQLGSGSAISGSASVIVNLDGGEMTIKGATPLSFVGGTTDYFDFDGGTLNVRASAVTNFATLTGIANSDFRVAGVTATDGALDFTAIDISGVPYTQITLPNLIWDGGSDVWTASNWIRGVTPAQAWIPKANVTFNTSDTNPETITLVGDISVNNLTFSVGGPYLIQDNSGDGADSLTIKNSTTVGSGVMATVTANVTAADVAVAGTLTVNGTLDATTVNVAGTLGGSGTITGNVVISDGGIMAPGNSPGVLTVDGDLDFVDTVLAGVPIYNWEVSNADEYDQVFVKNGTLTIADTLVINLTTFEPKRTLGETFVLFDFTDNASFAGDPSLWTVNVLGPYMSGTPQITQVDNQIILSGISFIPEPSTAILAGLGLMGLCLRRRR